jgi:hypothetical protein
MRVTVRCLGGRVSCESWYPLQLFTLSSLLTHTWGVCDWLSVTQDPTLAAEGHVCCPWAEVPSYDSGKNGSHTLRTHNAEMWWLCSFWEIGINQNGQKPYLEVAVTENNSLHWGVIIPNVKLLWRNNVSALSVSIPPRLPFFSEAKTCLEILHLMWEPEAVYRLRNRLSLATILSRIYLVCLVKVPLNFMFPSTNNVLQLFLYAV